MAVRGLGLQVPSGLLLPGTLFDGVGHAPGRALIVADAVAGGLIACRVGCSSGTRRTLAGGLRQVGLGLGPGGCGRVRVSACASRGIRAGGGGGRVCGCPYPGLSACAASSVPATGLSLRSPGRPEIFPGRGPPSWCRLRRRCSFFLARWETSWPARAARCAGPLPARRGHLTAGKGPAVPGRHQGGQPSRPPHQEESHEPDQHHRHRPPRR